ncbi:MAG: VanZ family protein [Maritimibacter sp.]|uniref:VanZ family protein n=1 Tax=Maritimibacter sp. TaxID=2003363 RepID=UPI001D4DFCF9|nr:VanZ family protein [Maritimibacter sp.]MBL6427632.1 VanZ family protein [Maritimibacter sp.]
MALTLGLTAVIAYLTLVPRPPAPVHFPHADKVFHTLSFAALMFPTPLLRPRRWHQVAVLALLFGAAIELIQPTFGREAEWADFAFDALGALLGTLAGFGVARVFQT